MPEENSQPDGTSIRTELYEIFERYGWLGRDITRATELLEHMAATLLLDRFEARLEARDAKLEAALEAQKAAQEARDAKQEARNVELRAAQEAQNTKLNQLLWFIGVGVAALIAAGIFA